MRRILVAIDGSPIALHALDAACELAQRTGADLALAYVVEPPTPVADLPTERTTAALLDALRATGDHHLFEAKKRCAAESLRAETFLRRGDPALELARLADELDADLVVCGTHGRGFMKRLVLGSVSTKLLHRATRPVLVVPPPPEPAHREASEHAPTPQP